MSDFNKRKCDEYEELLCDRVDIPEEPAKRPVVPNSVYSAVTARIEELKRDFGYTSMKIQVLGDTIAEMETWLDSVDMEDSDYE